MGFWETLFFWIFAFGAVASSLAVVVFRNPLYSAISLILDFFFFAGLYGLLSAHFMAIAQVLVYAGAIMVLFLFIIMLLNLKDSELGEFEFKLHHIVASGTMVALVTFIISAISPLVNVEKVQKARAEAIAQHATLMEAHAAKVAAAEQLTDEKQKATALRELRASEPRLTFQSPTSIKGPLYGDLNEVGMEKEWHRRLKAYEKNRPAPSQGKYRRFDPSKPMVMPPVMTGKELRTERGFIPAREPAAYGTVDVLSVLLVNRFVVPFQLTALLLLAAIVGAVIIAKRRL